MVATQDEEIFRVFDFVSKEQADSLQRLLASIYVITEEEIIGFRGKSAILEESKEVVVLAMDIATDLGRSQIK